MTKTVYYLTGMGGRLAEGLGTELIRRELNLSGRELSGDFKNLPFQDQISLVAADLRNEHWHPGARIIANSFGAYLFLHAQAELDPFIGKVLLLSPIVGEFSDDETMRTFSPPRPYRLAELINSGQYNAPLSCEIHVGELDWQSNPKNVAALATKLNISVSIVPNTGHMLSKEYVCSVLDKWL